MSGTTGMLHYSLEIKRKAVQLILEGRLIYAEVARKLSIPKTANIMA